MLAQEREDPRALARGPRGAAHRHPARPYRNDNDPEERRRRRVASSDTSDEQSSDDVLPGVAPQTAPEDDAKTR